MKCPYCKREGGRIHKDGKIYCSLCDGLLEDSYVKEKPTLKCPKCGNYSRNDYCSTCGYKFLSGVDY